MVEHLTFNQVVPGSSPGCLRKIPKVPGDGFGGFYQFRPEEIRAAGGYGGIGRRARFRFWSERVQVQVLLSAGTKEEEE